MNYDNYLKTGSMHKAVTDATRNAVLMDKMLSLVQSICANSFHPGAQSFDSRKWLLEWIDRPHSQLGGLKPSELFDTQSGRFCVLQLLAAMESGSYQ